MAEGMIDVVEWRPDDRDVFAWHYPKTNLTTYTQLIVAESQEAVLFKDGQMLGKFGPGRHTLDTKNLPLLNRILTMPFGGSVKSMLNYFVKEENLSPEEVKELLALVEQK